MTTQPVYMTPVLTTTEVQAMFKQGGAADSFFGNWLYEQLMGDRPHLLRDLVRVVESMSALARHVGDRPSAV